MNGAPSLRAMRSNLWRCSSLMPIATGTGTMPPSTAAQNASMNCSLLFSSRISLSPGLRAQLLQMVQHAQRARCSRRM